MTSPTPIQLTDEHRWMAIYRRSPAKWVEDHIDIKLAHYRERLVLSEWLAKSPEDAHVWCRRELAANKLNLDASKSYQGEALDCMATPGQYAFRWANGTAKTTTAALAVLWFLDVYADSRVLTTAGTWSQLQEQLWREIPLWADHAKRPIVAQGHIGRTQINVGPGWAAFGRGADKAETFEGVHAPHIMVLVDEAKAVKPEIFEAIRRILRGNEENSLWLICLSSPGSPSGPFYDICEGNQTERWTVFHLSAYESERVSLEQIEQDRLDLGENSPLFVAMDIGEFPSEASDTVVPLSWAQAAVDRKVNESGSATLGIDVARFGADSTTMISMFGRRAEISAVYRGKDTTWTATKALEMVQGGKYEAVGIDDGGVGGGVTDKIRSAHLAGHHTWRIRPVNFGETKTLRKPDRYVNLKAELYFMLRKELEDGFREPSNENVGVSIPNDRELIHQLTMQKYEYDDRNRYKIESHEALRRRGERSPDKADGLVIANYIRNRGFHHQARVKKTNIEATRGGGLAAEVVKADF